MRAQNIAQDVTETFVWWRKWNNEYFRSVLFFVDRFFPYFPFPLRAARLGSVLSFCLAPNNTKFQNLIIEQNTYSLHVYLFISFIWTAIVCSYRCIFRSDCCSLNERAFKGTRSKYKWKKWQNTHSGSWNNIWYFITVFTWAFVQLTLTAFLFFFCYLQFTIKLNTG